MGTRGLPVLEAATVALLLVAGGVFTSARARSDEVMRHEAEAVAVMARIARAQGERAAAGRPPALAQELAPDLASPGYRFSVHRVDAEGMPVCSHGERAPVGDYWIAYAWPRDYPRTGRRVFTTDASARVRAFANSLGAFSGNEAPPAILAPPPRGSEQPFREKRRGWLRHVRWEVVAGP